MPSDPPAVSAWQILIWIAVGTCPPAAYAQPPQPFFDANQHQTDYVGPGREAASPPNVAEVLVGYFGPTNPHDPQSNMWRAAQAAVGNANHQGGWQGKPFRLLPVWSENSWSAGASQLARLAYQQRVWAIVSGADGAAIHVAEQVAAKARIPLINAVSTDTSINLANVPWVFSLAPHDRLISETLATAIAGQTRGEPFIIVSADDHDCRQLTAQLTKALQRSHLHASYQFQYHRGSEDLVDLTSRVLQAKPAALLVIAGADDSASLVSSLRKGGYAGIIVGGPAVGRVQFLDRAGDAAEGVLFPWLVQSSVLSAAGSTHAQADPQPSAAGAPLPSSTCDYTTTLMADSLRILIEAIRTGGLNRARIRDALADMSPWAGAAGPVRWDGLGRNIRHVSLHRVVRGPEGLTWAESNPRQ